MARTKEEETVWESHRDELEGLWLDQRWTAKQIKDYMSQKYGFCRSQDQYTRQFKTWNLKKNLTDEEWNFVASRQEKRKRDGKDPGELRVSKRLVPEPKVRKETARHVTLSSQYLGLQGSDPKTPEGITVSTPRLETDCMAPDSSTPFLPTDLGQDLIVDVLNIGAPDWFQSTIGDPFVLPIEAPGLSSLGFDFAWDDGSVPVPSNLGDATLEHLPIVTPADTPISADRTGHFGYNAETMSKYIAEAACIALLGEPGMRERNHNDLTSALEPITIGDVSCDLTRGAENIFKSCSPENLSHYLKLCIYLSSNNLMSETATNSLASLIAKSRSHSKLKSLLKSRTTTIEVFMSNLLAGAAAVGDSETCQILIEAGADLDAPSGLTRRTALYRALNGRHISCVRILLEGGADPNIAIDGETPLHIACDRSSLDSVGLLLQFGAYVNPPQDSALLTPLQIAVYVGNSDLVKLLLSNRANPNLFTTTKKGTALQMACNQSKDATCVELLLDAGADIDAHLGRQCDDRDKSDFEDSDAESESSESPGDDSSDMFDALPNSFQPAILIAAQNENWEVVQLLLEEGAAVNSSLRKCPTKFLKWEVDDYGGFSDYPAVFTVLQAAVRAENITMTRMLLSAGAHIDARPKNKHGYTALQICAAIGNDRLIEILLRKGADVNAPAGVYCGRTALQAPAHLSDTKVLKLLLKEGACVNAPVAEEAGRTALQVAVAAGNIEGVMMLLDAKAVVRTNPALTGGVTILGEAIKIKDVVVRDEIVHLLLRAGAYTEPPRGQEIYAPIHTAVRQNNPEMTKRLLEKGANPNVGFCSLTNLTPLQQASSQGDEGLVQLLIDYGAEVNARPYYSEGRTALQAAACNGHMPVVKWLLNCGANIKAERASCKGISAIQAAVRGRNQDIIQLFLTKEPDVISSCPVTKSEIIAEALSSWRCDVSLLELLLKGGASIGNAQLSPSRMSLLQSAVQMHNFGVVQCLVSAGASVNHRWQRDGPGHATALQAAVSHRNIDTVWLLLESGSYVNAPANEKGGKTALQIAVSEKDRSMVELLMHYGADVNGPPSPTRGRTALQDAAMSGLVQLTQYLLAHGAKVNAPPAHLGGVTALQGAAIQGNIRILMMLLQAGAHINGAPAIEKGRNAIEGAAENGRLDTLHLLLNCHPDTEEFEIRKKRAAKLALANGHLAIGRFLMAYRKHAWKI